MRERLLELIECRDCGSSFELTVTQADSDGEIVTGSLACAKCATTFPVLRGIPRFIEGIKSDADLRAATVTLLDVARRMGKRIGTSRSELQGALQIRLQDANLRLRAPAVPERGVRMFINQRRNLGIAQRVHDSRKFCFVLARPEEDRGIGANFRRIERGDKRRSAGGALNHAFTVFGFAEGAKH